MNRHIGTVVIMVLAVMVGGCSKSDNGEQIAWEQYGVSMPAAEITPVGKVLDTPGNFEGRDVKLAGKVTGVCKGTGCWVKIDDGSGTTIIARSADHSVSVPKDCEGKRIEVMGTVMVEPPAEEEHTHDEALEEDHECPRPTVWVTMNAVKLEKSPE